MAGSVYEPMADASSRQESSAADPEDIVAHAQAAVGEAALPATWRRALIGIGCVAAVGVLACALMPASGRRAVNLQVASDHRSFSFKAEVSEEESEVLLFKDVWIKWGQDKDLCLNVAGGLATNGNVAQIGKCHKKDENMRFSVSKKGKGIIKWSSRKGKCLNAADGELLWWDCQDERIDEQEFELPEGKMGVIRLTSDPDQCIVVPTDGSDDTVELGDCDAAEAQFVVEDCPAGCEYAAWSEWSACSDMCGGGISARSRKVLQEAEDGQDCQHGRFETRRCNSQRCRAAAAV